MPLSKAMDRERKRAARLEWLSSPQGFQPKKDALQSTTRPLDEEGNTKPPVNLDGSGEIIPEYW